MSGAEMILMQMMLERLSRNMLLDEKVSNSSVFASNVMQRSVQQTQQRIA